MPDDFVIVNSWLYFQIICTCVRVCVYVCQCIITENAVLTFIYMRLLTSFHLLRCGLNLSRIKFPHTNSQHVDTHAHTLLFNNMENILRSKSKPFFNRIAFNSIHWKNIPTKLTNRNSKPNASDAFGKPILAWFVTQFLYLFHIHLHICFEFGVIAICERCEHSCCHPFTKMTLYTFKCCFQQ